MMISYKLLVASADAQAVDFLRGAFCHLANLIPIGEVSTAEALIQTVQVQQPDIVLLDQHLSEGSASDILEQLNAREVEERFVILFGRDTSDGASVLDAVRHGAFDVLGDIFDDTQLMRALSAALVRLKSRSARIASYVSGLHTNFLRREIMTLAQHPADLDMINDMFITDFRNGMFRIMSCVIYTDGEPGGSDGEAEEKVFSLISAIEQFCHCVIRCKEHSSFLSMFNYDPAMENQVLCALKEQLKTLNRTGNVKVNVYVSGATDSLKTANELKKQLTLVEEWSNLSRTKGAILFHDDIVHTSGHLYEDRLRKNISAIVASFEALDSQTFSEAFSKLGELAGFSSDFRELWLCLHRLNGKFKAINSELMDTCPEAKQVYRNMNNMLHVCTTHREYFQLMADKLAKILKLLSNASKQDEPWPVKQVRKFVMQNYGEAISLDLVAQRVNLSSAYLSKLFKQTTGYNFVDYLTEVRITKAKELLQNDDINVYEIASALGYTDARYFSTLFRKRVGISPTEYRNIHSSHELAETF